jgi:hypothetical protein
MLYVGAGSPGLMTDQNRSGRRIGNEMLRKYLPAGAFPGPVGLVSGGDGYKLFNCIENWWVL